jgi:hypothetical protein
VSDGAEHRRRPSNAVQNIRKSAGSARGLRRLLVLAAAAALAAGCSTSPAPAVSRGRVSPTYHADTGRLEKLAYDRNGDGREDAWAFMDGTRLLRAELDDNFDGPVDRREFYAPAEPGHRTGGTPGIHGLGALARVELISAGKAFRSETYEKGLLASADEDTDRDGRADKWERYENGALVSVALDTGGRGTPDRRLLYSSGGGAPRIETDPDGSGHFRAAAPSP